MGVCVMFFLFIVLSAILALFIIGNKSADFKKENKILK